MSVALSTVISTLINFSAFRPRTHQFSNNAKSEVPKSDQSCYKSVQFGRIYLVTVIQGIRSIGRYIYLYQLYPHRYVRKSRTKLQSKSDQNKLSMTPRVPPRLTGSRCNLLGVEQAPLLIALAAPFELVRPALVDGVKVLQREFLASGITTALYIEYDLNCGTDASAP